MQRQCKLRSGGRRPRLLIQHYPSQSLFPQSPGELAIQPLLRCSQDQGCTVLRVPLSDSSHGQGVPREIQSHSVLSPHTHLPRHSSQLCPQAPFCADSPPGACGQLSCPLRSFLAQSLLSLPLPHLSWVPGCPTTGLAHDK